jgi:hypothetical protein
VCALEVLKRRRRVVEPEREPPQVEVHLDIPGVRTRDPAEGLLGFRVLPGLVERHGLGVTLGLAGARGR